MLKPELHRFGITRVAQQTRLDTIGIACYAAIRPNSRTLAVHQGKGPDDQAAWVSAVMEAVEFAVAETPAAPLSWASLHELTAAGDDVLMPAWLLPVDYRCDPARPLSWLTGYRLASGEPVKVPLDSVALAPTAGALPFSQSSNGLAAGFSRGEAVMHAVCELIERDAASLWSLRPARFCAATAIMLDPIVDREARASIDLALQAGFSLALFDLTTDLGVPAIMAMLWSGQPAGFFDVASGVCSHPSAGRAVAAAIREAAQTRISNIAGARDDIDPAEYYRPLPEWLVALTRATTAPSRRLPPSMPEADLAALPAAIDRQAIVVPLSAAGDPICVVKVLSETLEDRTTNAHWRPGRRAIRAMTSL